MSQAARASRAMGVPRGPGRQPLRCIVLLLSASCVYSFYPGGRVRGPTTSPWGSRAARSASRIDLGPSVSEKRAGGAHVPAKGSSQPKIVRPPSLVEPPADLTPGDSSMLWGKAGGPLVRPDEHVLVGQHARRPQELPVAPWKRDDVLKDAYKECERITSAYAKTFYLGTSFLDQTKRASTWAIYVWCRRTDDIVDSPRAIVEKTMEADLDLWNRRLDDIWRGRPWDALDATLCDVREKFPTMSIEPFKDMIAGMVMDVPGMGRMRYETFDDLYLYCYRVAGTVGLMTLPVMGTAEGYTEKQATEPALALGIALQLTNILRDVGEDVVRGRIYLPLEDLERFGVTEDQIMNKIMNSNYRSLIKFEIARAREYFDKAEAGIRMLSPDARLPVRASLDMYRKILDVIEENDYDNFRKRAYVGKMEKLLTLPSSWLKTLEAA